MTRQAFAFVRRDSVIFWSRKAGNTSLADWLYDGALVRGTVWQEDDESEGDPVRRKHLVPLVMGQYIVNFRTALSLVHQMGYRNYVLARNPFARAASAFVNKFVIDGDRVCSGFDALEGLTRRSVADMANLLPGFCSVGKDYRGITFEEFLEYVLLRVKRRDDEYDEEPNLNYHWNTQVPFYYKNRFSYGKVIKLESVHDDIAALAKRLRIKRPFPALRTSGKPKCAYTNAGELASVKSTDLARAGIAPTPISLFSARACDLVREAYEIDFHKLQYPLLTSEEALWSLSEDIQ